MSRRYTSGQFARLCHTTKDTLFHYDRLGLLRPRYKGENGYRYYDIRQFLQFDMISLFKETGTPLRDMRACLAAAADGDILPLLEEKARRLADERRRLAEREALVGNLLEVVREARATEADRLLLRHLAASRWEVLPQRMRGLETEAGMVQASAVFMESFRRAGRTPGLPTGILYRVEDFLAGRLGEARLFAPADAATPPEVIRESPAALYAVFAHRGPWEEQIACWLALPELLRRQGLRPVGPAGMLEMGSYALTGSSAECVMHCRIPVVPDGAAQGQASTAADRELPGAGPGPGPSAEAGQADSCGADMP